MKNLPLTPCPVNPLMCYTWSNRGKNPKRKDGVQLCYFVCSGCRSLVAKGLNVQDNPLPAMRADLTSNTWLDAAPKNKHFCEPRLLSEANQWISFGHIFSLCKSPDQRLRITRKAIMENKGSTSERKRRWRVDSMLQRWETATRPQSELCQQLTEELVTADVYFDNVLEHQVVDENFPEKLRSYLQRVGHLMGFNESIDAIEGFPAEEEVESEQEEIIEEGDPAEINLFDV
uniref:Uncharacterized protein n=1 Tax=Ditylenchus dipsaci TaxID=166011 RepID=A0A915E5V6_9BILA